MKTRKGVELAAQRGRTALAEHSAHLRVECPLCHWKQWVDVELEKPFEDSAMAREIQSHLETWIASRCPDHLLAIARAARN